MVSNLAADSVIIALDASPSRASVPSGEVVTNGSLLLPLLLLPLSIVFV